MEGRYAGVIVETSEGVFSIKNIHPVIGEVEMGGEIFLLVSQEAVNVEEGAESNGY